MNKQKTPAENSEMLKITTLFQNRLSRTNDLTIAIAEKVDTLYSLPEDLSETKDIREKGNDMVSELYEKIGTLDDYNDRLERILRNLTALV